MRPTHGAPQSKTGTAAFTFEMTAAAAVPVAAVGLLVFGMGAVVLVRRPRPA